MVYMPGVNGAAASSCRDYNVFYQKRYGLEGKSKGQTNG
jgi:hypothetical protein